MTAVISGAPTLAVDPEELGVTGIRVDIADLGRCFTACAPELPPTGFDGMLVVVAASIGLVLVAGGILFAVTHRRFSDRTTHAR